MTSAPLCTRARGSSPFERLFEALFLSMIAVLPIMQIHVRFRAYVIPPVDFLFPPAVLALALSVASGRPLRRSSVYLPLCHRPGSIRRADRLAPSPLVLAFAGGLLYQSITGSFEQARHVWVIIGLVAAVRNLAAPPADGFLQPRRSAE